MMSLYARYFAMRLTHMPTGISVQTGDCPPDRSMYKTRLLLMKLLASKLWFHKQDVDLTKEIRCYGQEMEGMHKSESVLMKAFEERRKNANVADC